MQRDLADPFTLHPTVLKPFLDMFFDNIGFFPLVSQFVAVLFELYLCVMSHSGQPPCAQSHPIQSQLNSGSLQSSLSHLSRLGPFAYTGDNYLVFLFSLLVSSRSVEQHVWRNTRFFFSLSSQSIPHSPIHCHFHTQTRAASLCSSLPCVLCLSLNLPQTPAWWVG